MKKLLLTFAAALLGLCSANAETTELYKLEFSEKTSAGFTVDGTSFAGSTASYSNSWYAKCDDVIWNLTNFNGGAKGSYYTYARCGSKSAESTATITNYAAWSDKISEVVLNIQKTSNCSTDITTAKLDVFEITDGAETVAYSADFTEKFNALTKGGDASDITLVIPEPAANMYYRITFVCPKDKNGTVQVNSVKYNGEKDATVVDKLDAKVAFSATTANVILSEAASFESLIATTESDGTLEYTSTNTAVATVDAETGIVTILKGGETTIKAYVEATETYKSGEATYTLTVVDDTPAPVGTFDFATCNGITFNGGAEVEFDKDGAFEVSTMEKDDVTITNTNGTGTSTRLFKNKDGIQLRVYTDNQLTFTCPEKKQFKTITFDGSASIKADKGVYDKGTWTNGTASAAYVKAYAEGEDEDDVEAGETTDAAESFRIVTFTATGTCKLSSISFDLETSTGVEEIEAEATGEAAYYNLQGVRVANPAHGIYIRVQGNRATKVML